VLVRAEGFKLNVCIVSTFRSLDTNVYIIAGSSKNLLGLPDIRGLNLLATINSLCSSKFDPFRVFPEVFQGLGTLPYVFTTNVKRGIVPKCLYTPRTIAAGLKEKVKLEIDNMLKNKMIEPVKMPAEWCSGLTLALKQGGKIRMCVGLTELNKGVKREIYPLPKVPKMLSVLAKGRMFSKLDVNSSFWQVKLDSKRKLLTTFITPWGRFCFNPFAINFEIT